MKIYLIPVSPILQPNSQRIEYPSGNSDYGVEQDFLAYLQSSHLLTDSPEEADWHYLPVFWTRWHLNHDYGKVGVAELQSKVAKALLNPDKTFTICQYDDGPVVELGKTKLFLASRKGDEGIDIPLLRNDLKLPLLKPRKHHLASFVGRVMTHPTRQQMVKLLSGIKNVLISDGDKGQQFFIDTTLRSYIALCPRGYGGSSFRLFEAMQLGVVPLLLGDKDTRPFKNFINWDEISFFVNIPEDLPKLLGTVTKRQLKNMGAEARKVYRENLQYSKWCSYVIKELEATG